MRAITNLLRVVIVKAVIAVVFFYGWPFSVPCAAASPQVMVLTLEDATINPVTAEYIQSGIEEAEKSGAQAVILQLDTPGGLLNSTHSIVKSILNARIPVIVYIAPPGSRAASAGVFITYAAHVAAMAPSTHLGAAHPVTLGGGWPGLKEKKISEQKSTDKKTNNSEDTSENNGQIKEIAREDKNTIASDEKKNDSSEPENVPKTDGSSQKQEEPPTQTTTHPSEESLDADSSSNDPMADKILNDTTAFVRSLAKTRGRNAEWAVKSVVESATLDAEEAVALNVVDFLAADLNDLLQKVSGREIIIQGQKRILNLEHAVLIHKPMTLRQKLLNILVDPNLAYILLILGFYGLLYEVTHPGLGIPGFLGAVFLILAFYALQTLPTNYAALLLLALGAALFIAEAMAPGIGLLAVGGVIAMGLGSLLLFETPYAEIEISRELIIGFTLSTAILTIILVRAAIQAHKNKPLSGMEAMIGETGEVTKEIDHGKEGFVFVHGELWRAVSKHHLQKGDRVRVISVHGNLLEVEPHRQEMS